MTELEREAAALQERFGQPRGQPGPVAFTVSPLGGVVATLTVGVASAVVALQGAQVLSWVPRQDQPDVLWCSPLSRLGLGKPVRGGIPVCWPWFGPHADAALALPAHGFVRAVPWAVESADLRPGTASVTFAVSLTAAQQAVAGDVRARLRVNLGSDLEIELITTNNGAVPVSLTEALHTYFAIGDIGAVSVAGLAGQTYLDQLTGLDATQSGAITFDQETDRIYWDTSGKILRIQDEALGRSIDIGASGSASTVIWNPWHEKAVRLGDMPPDGYRTMLCAETANVGPRNAVSIAPGDTHTLAARFKSAKI